MVLRTTPERAEKEMGQQQSAKKPAARRRRGGRQRAVGAIRTQKEQMAVMEKRIKFHEKKVKKLRREAKALLQAAKTPRRRKWPSARPCRSSNR